MVDICAYVFCHLVPKQFAFLHSKLTVYYPIGEIKWISKALLGVQMILWAIARKGKLWKVDFNLTTILFQLICFYLYLETCDFFFLQFLNLIKIKKFDLDKLSFCNSVLFVYRQIGISVSCTKN